MERKAQAAKQPKEAKLEFKFKMSSTLHGANAWPSRQQQAKAQTDCELKLQLSSSKKIKRKQNNNSKQDKARESKNQLKSNKIKHTFRWSCF